MASVCRDLHQVSVRYESSSAQSTVRYRVEVRVTDGIGDGMNRAVILINERPSFLTVRVLLAQK